jgi:hypothetical protein
MSFLKTLTFSSASELTPSPIEKKRLQLIARLKDQLALLDDPKLTTTRKRWTKVGSERVLEQNTIPVRPWWNQTADGKVALVVRSGLKRIEFDKGKTAILLPSFDDLPRVLKGLIDAVQKGELDHLLEAKAPIASVPKRKTA